MNKIKIKVKILEHFDPAFSLPQYETAGASGADVRACLAGADESLVIRPGERVLVPTGLCMEIPVGHEVQVRPRSGLSWKTSLMVINSPGTIDADYRGELKILLGNWGKEAETVRHGDRIAQLVVVPVLQGEFVRVDDVSETLRGAGGFGSTGINRERLVEVSRTNNENQKMKN